MTAEEKKEMAELRKAYNIAADYMRAVIAQLPCSAKPRMGTTHLGILLDEQYAAGYREGHKDALEGRD
jgi:hypothetical protein